MARPNLKLTVSPAQKAVLETRFKAADDVRQRQRLQAILLATTGQHGYRDIAQIVGCATSTFALWLNKYLAGGLEELLRRETPAGLTSPIGDQKVQQELQAGLKAGRWRTAGQVAAWLQEAHGIKRAAKSMYRWLGKANGALRVPRPAHVLQNPPAAAAFRAELEQRLEQLALPDLWLAVRTQHRLDRVDIVQILVRSNVVFDELVGLRLLLELGPAGEARVDRHVADACFGQLGTHDGHERREVGQDLFGRFAGVDVVAAGPKHD